MARTMLLLFAVPPLAAQAVEPATKLPAQAARPVADAAPRAAEPDLEFLEFLGEIADGDKAFDEFLLSRHAGGLDARADEARRRAAKDGTP